MKNKVPTVAERNSEIVRKENKKIPQEFRCAYPKCKREGFYKQSFELINEEGALTELLFCEYHYLIVMGGHFKAKIVERMNKAKIEHDFELIGPFKEIELIQQVIGARELIKLRSDNKDLKA